MIKIWDPGRGLVRCSALAAAAILVLSAAPGQRAEALSLINPGAAQSVQDEAKPTTEVRWNRWHRHHWGRPHWRGHRWHHRRW